MLDLTNPKLTWMRDLGNLNLAIRTLEQLAMKAMAGQLGGPDTIGEFPGICSTWAGELTAAKLPSSTAVNWSHDLIKYAAMSWPHSVKPGKRTPYPVPHTEHMWRGEGLELRLSLINHTLELLEACRNHLTKEA